MANITRITPREELTRFDPFREMESFFRSPWSWLRERDGEAEMRMDITEDDKAYHVKAELPGIKKEDIRVEIDGNEVSISGEVRKEREEKKGESVVRSERYYGKQFRSFTLRHEVDPAKATAKYADGVLELSLPKQEGAPAKVVTVQ
jgi:HSP20 family protein